MLRATHAVLARLTQVLVVRLARFARTTIFLNILLSRWKAIIQFTDLLIQILQHLSHVSPIMLLLLKTHIFCVVNYTCIDYGVIK